jgi:hypothetical protein
MCIGWGSYSFQRYDPGAKTPPPGWTQGTTYYSGYKVGILLISEI